MNDRHSLPASAKAVTEPAGLGEGDDDDELDAGEARHGAREARRRSKAMMTSSTPAKAVTEPASLGDGRCQ